MQGRLRELLHKYDLLVALRLQAEGRTPARREAMREVAARFPAALREWDCQPLEELRRRQEIVGQALQQAEQGLRPQALDAEPWLRYGLDLHDHLLSLLRLRRFLLGLPAGIIGEGQLDACQRFQESQGGPVLLGPLTADRLRCIAAPQGGRLTALAYTDLAAVHGVSVEDIKRALFHPVRHPVRHPARYAGSSAKE